jgi:hypothetical protein
MEAAVARVVRQIDAKRTVSELKLELLDWGRTTTLRLYNGAFDETEDYDAIKREFLPLVEMTTREAEGLKASPTLDNSPLTNGKNSNAAVFPGKAALQDEALKFVQGRSKEYDRK